jgi:hypothetical protein
MMLKHTKVKKIVKVSLNKFKIIDRFLNEIFYLDFMNINFPLSSIRNMYSSTPKFDQTTLKDDSKIHFWQKSNINLFNSKY